MLDISDDTYRRILAEEEEYARLLASTRRRDLRRGLGVRTGLLGILTVAFGIAGMIPRFRPFLFAAAVALPLLVWQLSCVFRGEAWVESVLSAEAEERRLEVLRERHGMRQDMIQQKAAQDEIERLRTEIEAIRKGAEPQ